jgi:hypothetical protein
MYKTKIKTWHLKKYVKASEKEKMAAFIEEQNIGPDEMHRLRWRGRPAPLHLVRRDFKRRGIKNDFANTLPTKARGDRLLTPNREDSRSSASSMTPSTVSSQRRTSSLSAPVPTALQWTLSDTTGQVASHTQHYVESFWSNRRPAGQPQTTSVPTQLPDDHIATFCSKLTLALDQLIDVGHSQGWAVISEACDGARMLITRHSPNFLSQIILMFTDERWQIVPQLRESLIRYLSNMAATVLGPNHSLTTILRGLRSEGTLDAAAEPLLRIVANASPTSPVENSMPADLSLSELLRRRGNFDQALNVGSRRCSEAELLHGPDHALMRESLSNLADTHLQEGSTDVARESYRDALRRSTSREESPHTAEEYSIMFDEATMFSLQALCHIDLAHHQSKERMSDMDHEALLEQVLVELGTSKEEVRGHLARWCQPLNYRQRWLSSKRCSDNSLARWARHPS